MTTAILLALVITAIGGRASDALKLEAERVILEKLPLSDAHAYYERLKRRVWRARMQKTIVLVSLMLGSFVLRRRLAPAKPAPAPTMNSALESGRVSGILAAGPSFLAVPTATDDHHAIC